MNNTSEVVTLSVMAYKPLRSTRLIQRIAAQQAVRPVRVPGIDEEPLEQRQAVFSQDTGDHRQLRIPVQGRQTGSVAFGPAPHHIFIGVDDPADAAEHDGGKAHEARFHRAVNGQPRTIDVRHGAV